MTYCVDRQKWEAFSRDAQLKNIAAELARMTSAGLRVFEKESTAQQMQAGERALAMIDATITDSRWQNKKPLYELRDAVAALYAEHSDPALSRIIASHILDRAELENKK